MSSLVNQLGSMTLGDIAVNIPSATIIFRRYGLDFCCAGKRSLDSAIEEKGLESAPILAELNAAAAQKQQHAFAIPKSTEDYQTLTNYIVENFHDKHRQQLPELILLAQRVEKVHAGKDSCPTGLAQHLQHMFEELFLHMEKEENILFPLLNQGKREQAQGPISVMEEEHTDHGEALETTRTITHNLTLPEGACNTWRALYQGLLELEEDLIQHIHTENNLLFAR